MKPQDILKEHLAKSITLTDDEFEYFFSHFKLKLFKKGQTIISLGDLVDSEFFVSSGCLKTFYVNDDEKMFILQFATSNWWASDYSALNDGVAATVSIDCITDTEVLSITSEDREKLCSENHQLSYFFRWRSLKGYVASQKRLISFMNKDARHRYEEFMKMYPLLYNIVPKKLIAAYLGVSRETLSRLYQS
jgi:CRP-like cAMP-binding protein